MHIVTVKGILSPKNGMNLYRGCTHGCIYCDSRSKCYNMNHQFEDIEVKINAPELLEAALKRKRKKCMISTGAMTDPYIHIEENIKNTRKSLEIINEYGFGLSILTKSSRILRDLDLLKKINKTTKVVVQMTLTTYDESLCKIIEPHVSTTKERFEILKVMRDNGIPTIVWLTPILPFINDNEENIRGLLNYCIEAKVWGVISFGMGLTLREGNREYFYDNLDKNFKGLKEKYINTYGYSYEIISPRNKELVDLTKDICKAKNIVFDSRKCFEYLHSFEEKSSFEQLKLL